ALNAKLAELDEALAIDDNDDAVLAIIADLADIVEAMDAIVYYNVTFTVDGAEVKTERVRAGESATAPDEDAYINNGANHKKFSGWTGDYTNVTDDITITATYNEEAHNWIDGEVTKEANCHETGTQAKSCACGATNEKTLPIDDTVHVGGVGTRKENETQGSCTTAPTWDEIEYCLGCGATLSSTPVTGTINENAHDWGEWTVTTPATCAAAGEETRVCANNPNHKETREIPATGAHEWKWVVDTDATCDAPGVKHEKCKNCDATRSEGTAIPAKGHTFSAWTVTKPATCKEAGTEARICAACGETETRSILKTNAHSWGAWTVAKEATCAAAGEQTRTCSVCGKVETKAIDKLEHSWGEWINDDGSEATCTTGGTQHRECANCGEIETRNLPGGFGHHVVNPNLRGEGYCEYCGEFICNHCASLTQFEDLEIVGIFYRIVHFFIHFAHMISYHSGAI
ncbi:MAG: hypothetical protein IJK23_14450, partial [Clostridia bacterium]|nr:hypothetical protein [Clostridia bacterium]